MIIKKKFSKEIPIQNQLDKKDNQSDEERGQDSMLEGKAVRVMQQPEEGDDSPEDRKQDIHDKGEWFSDLLPVLFLRLYVGACWSYHVAQAQTPPWALQADHVGICLSILLQLNPF